MDNDSLVEIVKAQLLTNWIYKSLHTEELIGMGLEDDEVIKAMRKRDRGKFFPPSYPHNPNSYRMVYNDLNLPVAYPNSINTATTNPSFVAFMFYHLQLEKGLKVFELGTGTGWPTAIMLELIGTNGHLVSAEIELKLAEMALANLRADFGEEDLERRLSLISGNGLDSLKTEAPFDRIYFTVGVEPDFGIPQLSRFLKPNGMLLIPQRDYPNFISDKSGVLVKQTYVNGTLASERKYKGFYFTPLIEKVS